eukprot:Rmarinus@m.10545
MSASTSTQPWHDLVGFLLVEVENVGTVSMATMGSVGQGIVVAAMMNEGTMSGADATTTTATTKKKRGLGLTRGRSERKTRSAAVGKIITTINAAAMTQKTNAITIKAGSVMKRRPAMKRALTRRPEEAKERKLRRVARPRGKKRKKKRRKRRKRRKRKIRKEMKESNTSI